MISTGPSLSTQLRKTSPSKVGQGCTKFANDDPPLQLVVINGDLDPEMINHRGVEVTASEDILAAPVFHA